MAWSELSLQVRGARERFENAAQSPRAAQDALLRAIVSRHAATDFGRRHGFASVNDLAAFRRRVPVADPETFAAEIQAMAGGISHRLVAEPVLAFEPTAGTSGGSRLIPLTASGLAAMQAGLYAWLDDLCVARPGIMAGTSYWSISPVARAQAYTTGGTPIGLTSDAEYFGDAARQLLGVLAVSPVIAHVGDVDDWRMLTLQCLLADSRLSLVSVWSPTFWLELCRHALERRDALQRAIGEGYWVAAIPVALKSMLPVPAADPARARRIGEVLATSSPDWAALWPQLCVISCWTHASAGPWAGQLARAFPASEIQGKGLLATEGMVSIPLCDGGDPVAAVSSAVIEFETDSGDVLACDEVSIGEEYTIVITTSAGLYRYRLGDRVRVTGWWHATPRLRLLGRGISSSDLCGEKLTEAFVMHCREQAGLDAIAGMRLVPSRDPRPHYALLFDEAELDAAAAGEAAVRFELALRANPHYAYARELGQLGALLVHRVDRLAGRLQDLALRQGQRLGDAKPMVLGRLNDLDLAAAAPW